MPGKPSNQQGLFDDGSLIGLLQSTLEAMEEAAGGELSEERAKLHELQRALGGMRGGVSPKPAETDELKLASELDKLEQQLEAVELQIASADTGAKEILTNCTAVWAGSSPQGEGSGHSAAAADGDSSGELAVDACDGAGVKDQAPFASGLLPVAEQPEEEEDAGGK